MITNEMFDQFAASGIVDSVMPMLLIFCIVYLAMFKSKILGENKATKVLIALVMSLIAVVPHILGTYPAGYDVISIMNKMMGGFAIFVLGILIAVLVLTLIIKDPKNAIMGANYLYFLPLIILSYIAYALPHLWVFAVLIILFVFLIGFATGAKTSANFYAAILLIALAIFDWAFGFPRTLPTWLQFLEDGTFQTIVIAVLAFVFIMSLVTGKDEK